MSVPLRDGQRADGVRLRLLARLGDTADCGEVGVGTDRLGEGCCQPGIVPDRLEDLDLTTARAVESTSDACARFHELRIEFRTGIFAVTTTSHPLRSHRLGQPT